VKARIVSIVTVLSTCLVISGPAFAHHSMSMYDRGQETTFKATITQLLGQSAHADHFHRHRWPRQRREMGGGRSRSEPPSESRLEQGFAQTGRRDNDYRQSQPGRFANYAF